MTNGLKCFLYLVVPWLVAISAFGQRKELADVPWAPPADLDLAQDVAPKPTIPRAMITALRVGPMSIRLEKTELAAVRERFGGEEGRRGDAGSALEWLCYAGQDPDGRWALWLTSSEIDGPSVGSFEWRRVAESAHFDPRCAELPKHTDIVLSFVPLRLGISQNQVFGLLGTPTTHRGDVLDYEHNEVKRINRETYNLWNSVALRFLNGNVDSIRVTETDAD